MYWPNHKYGQFGCLYRVLHRSVNGYEATKEMIDPETGVGPPKYRNYSRYRRIICTQGWIKSRLSVLFRTDSFRTQIYYRQFQKFLLVIDSFRPNRCGQIWPCHTQKICAEVTFLVKENIKEAFLRERQIYSPSSTIVLFYSY